MKKIISFLLLIILLTALLGCSGKKAEQASNWEKQDINTFKSLFNDFAKKQNIKLTDAEMNAFRDITPQNVFDETSCQIFKNGMNCESYLLCDGAIYTLGIGFGGFGVTDVVTCDFDGNGKKELLYTYSFGSGIHRSNFGCFDLSKKSNEKVDVSSAPSLIQEDLVFEKVSDTEIKVYTSKLKSDGPNFTKLSFKKDKLFGEIKAVQGNPVLSLEEQG